MSASDWQYIVGGAGGSAGGSSTATLNSTLSSPLMVGSSYCRRLYNTPNGFSGNSYTNLFISSSYLSGSFYNIPNTKAIRVQSHIRLDSSTFSGRAYIGAKIVSTGDLGSFDGYFLTINNTGQTNLITENSSSSNLMTVSMNTWYGFRLEIYPIGSASDRIKAYIESGSVGSNIWTQIADVTVNNPSTGYVNWGENRKIGFGAVTTQFNGTTTAYFDNFSASVANAPTPIP